MASQQFQEWWSRFARTGNIAPLQLGFSREQVRAVLGEPDDVSSEKQGRQAAIWLYDSLEFHFGSKHDDPLWLIYQDTVDGVVQVTIQRLRE